MLSFKTFYNFFFIFKKKEIIKETEIEKTTYKKYITGHGKKRFEERHGIYFGQAMAKEVIEKIETKNATKFKKTNGSEQWIVEYKDKKYRVAYDPDKKVIITVYPGTKIKKRKPKRKKENRYNGTKVRQKDLTKGSYKRNKKVMYDEAI